MAAVSATLVSVVSTRVSVGVFLSAFSASQLLNSIPRSKKRFDLLQTVLYALALGAPKRLHAQPMRPAIQ